MPVCDDAEWGSIYQTVKYFFRYRAKHFIELCHYIQELPTSTNVRFFGPTLYWETVAISWPSALSETSQIVFGPSLYNAVMMNWTIVQHNMQTSCAVLMLWSGVGRKKVGKGQTRVFIKTDVLGGTDWGIGKGAHWNLRPLRCYAPCALCLPLCPTTQAGTAPASTWLALFYSGMAARWCDYRRRGPSVTVTPRFVTSRAAGTTTGELSATSGTVHHDGV